MTDVRQHLKRFTPAERSNLQVVEFLVVETRAVDAEALLSKQADARRQLNDSEIEAISEIVRSVR